ncbi:MAG: MarR family winged helix-turn-helix transcriptional regulator [Eubacteriaceae bacterium]
MKDIYLVLNEALVLIFNLVLKSEEKFIRSLVAKKLSITEIHTIDAIGKDSKKTMSEIATNLNITLGTLTTSINNLEKKGFVKRNRSEKDRRVVYVSLIEKGNEVFDQHDIFHKNMIKHIVNDLNQNEEKALVKALENLIGYFMDNINK